MTAVLQVDGLTKQFAKADAAIVALRDFSLDIEEGSFVTVLGRSGCGKSTMLNLLAGLAEPTTGTVRYRDQILAGPHLEEVPTSPEIDEQAYETAMRFHLDSGLVRKAPTYGDVIPEAFRN